MAEDADLSYVLSEYVWNLVGLAFHYITHTFHRNLQLFLHQVNQEYNKISNYCNPKTDAIALNEDGIRPIRPKSVPDFV